MAIDEGTSNKAGRGFSQFFGLNDLVRSDGFTNYNGNGEAYVEQKNNWAPRLGFSWDVNGDSTFKVFGNMGRYHLALPNNVSVRGSNPSLSSTQYFTYTGIAADGTPTGLAAIPYTNPNSPYTCTNGGMSSNVECGYPKDPRTIAQIDLWLSAAGKPTLSGGTCA